MGIANHIEFSFSNTSLSKSLHYNFRNVLALVQENWLLMQAKTSYFHYWDSNTPSTYEGTCSYRMDSLCIHYHSTGECLIHELGPTSESLQNANTESQNSYSLCAIFRCLYQRLENVSCFCKLWILTTGHPWSWRTTERKGRCKHVETRCTISYFTRGNQTESWPLWVDNTEQEEAVPLRNIINMSPGGETRDQNRRVPETAVVAFAWSRR
jgi:hypothetical protein